MQEKVSGLPKLLSLAVHEFRTPVTVVGGYLRMLLTERAGPLAENQRKLLEEAEKSCGRLSMLIGEMSELGQLLDGRQSLSTSPVGLSDLLKEIGARLPASPSQPPVNMDAGSDPLIVSGDGARLRRVLETMLFALRREIIDESALVIEARSRMSNGDRAAWITFGTPPVAAALREAGAATLEPFDVWRGGCGLMLPLCQHVVELHGGRLFALAPDAVRAAIGEPEPSAASEPDPSAGPRQAGGAIELPLVR